MGGGSGKGFWVRGGQMMGWWPTVQAAGRGESQVLAAPAGAAVPCHTSDT